MNSLLRRSFEGDFAFTALGRNVDPFTLHIYAALAEQERRMISQRTSTGLQAAKAKGKKLGTYGKVLGAKNAAAAAERDAKLESVMIELKHLSPRAAAAEIERRGLGKLSYQTIARARARLGIEKAGGANRRRFTVRDQEGLLG